MKFKMHFLVLGAFLALCVAQWNSPAIEDEVLHQRCKLVWLKDGASWCELSHTPFYHEATSVWQKMLGPATLSGSQNRIWVLRSFGVAAYLVAIALFLFGLAQLLKKKIKSKGRLAHAPLLALALLCLHPYFIQSALHLNYDSIQLPFLFLIVLGIEFWDERERPGFRWAIGGSILFAAALFVKELSPLILLALWPFWAFLRRWRSSSKSFIPHLTQALAAIPLALAVFFLLLWSWGQWRGFHWSDPLLLTEHKFLGRAGGDSGGFAPWRHWGLARFLFLTYLPLLWLNIPMLFSFFMLWTNKKPNEKKAATPRFLAQHIPFSLLVVLGLFATYTVLVQAAFYFPVYTVAAWPLLLFGACRFLPAPNRPEMKITWAREKWTLTILFACCFIFGILEFFDPLLLIENRNDFSLPVVAKHFVALAAPILALETIRRISRSWMLLGLLFYFFGTDIGQAIHPYSTRYLYGERGFEETVQTMQKLKALISPHTRVLSAARDVDWALQENSELLDFERLHSDDALSKHAVVVSRTYGYDSVAEHPEWKATIEKMFQCHDFIFTQNHRFEWWWKCRR